MESLYQAESWALKSDLIRVGLIFSVSQGIPATHCEQTQVAWPEATESGQESENSSAPLCQAHSYKLCGVAFLLVIVKQINLISQNADVRAPNCSRK